MLSRCCPLLQPAACCLLPDRGHTYARAATAAAAAAGVEVEVTDGRGSVGY